MRHRRRRPRSTFALTEARIGVAPAIISLTLLPKMSARAAARYYLTGETFDAAVAAEIGLITLAADDVDAAVASLVADIGQGSPQGLAASKALTTAAVLDGFDRDAERLAAESARLFVSDEAREGMLAFLEKRPPSWATLDEPAATRPGSAAISKGGARRLTDGWRLCCAACSPAGSVHRPPGRCARRRRREPDRIRGGGGTGRGTHRPQRGQLPAPAPARAPGCAKSLADWAHGHWWGLFVVVLVCMVAAAIAAALVHRIEPHAEGSGIPRVEAVADGRVRPTDSGSADKYVGGLLAIGSGMALGREGPPSRWAEPRPSSSPPDPRNMADLRILVAGGAAAGLATAFNAPIAGGVFVLEELVKQFDPRTASPRSWRPHPVSLPPTYWCNHTPSST